MKEDYLYNCNGCGKDDENYPDKETACEECGGSGCGSGNFETEDGCGHCNGYGYFVHRLPRIDYHEWARNDAYGLFTGLYCHDCYEDSEKYPYRKDRYFDKAYCGESLGTDSNGEIVDY